MSVHSVSDNGPIDFKDFKAWNKKVPKRAMPIKVRAYIYQARDLPAADSEGTSDPFVQAWDVTATAKKKPTTAVVEDNCNPLFYETLELQYDVDNQDDLESYPPFIFDIFDHDDDLFDSTPDYLCRAVVEPEDCSIKMEKDWKTCEEHGNDDCKMCFGILQRYIPDKPRWHPCYFSPGQPQCGEILVSFSVSSDEFRYPFIPREVNLASLVQVREFGVNMNILGMRNLASPGILPVKKAFCKFNIKSLVPPNGPAVKNI